MSKRTKLETKYVVLLCAIAFVFPIFFWYRDWLNEISVPYPRPFSRPIPHFVPSGNSQCLPPATPGFLDESILKRATCRRFSPFLTGNARIASVTAHFGPVTAHYQKALQTHLLHSLIHGTEVRVLCDPITNGLWNKPAFILDVLMREMMKPATERLEWIMWADRDTLILDQCRPITSFLPPEKSRYNMWKGASTNQTEVNLLVTNDFNGLNNGVFLLRVNKWALSLFTDILAFQHYRPDVYLPYTEQSAMEHLIWSEHYRSKTQFVPQHWFNAYAYEGPMWFAESNDTSVLESYQARRGDFLMHFAGNPDKAGTIINYTDMLQSLLDVWKSETVQRDVSGEVVEFWRKLGS